MPCTRNSVWLFIAIERPYLYASACVAKDFESRLAPPLRTPQSPPARTTYTSFFIFTFQAVRPLFVRLCYPPPHGFGFADHPRLTFKVRFGILPSYSFQPKEVYPQGLLLCCESKAMIVRAIVAFSSPHLLTVPFRVSERPPSASCSHFCFPRHGPLRRAAISRRTHAQQAPAESGTPRKRRHHSGHSFREDACH